jgi:WD40 repeat protein
MTEEELFALALEQKTAAARSALVDEACAGDEELRSQVLLLLEAHEQAGDFLQCSALEELGHVVQAASEDTQDLVSRRDRDGVLGDTPYGSDIALVDHGDDEPLACLAPPSRSGTLGRLGRYDVVQVVGRGGMGIVLKAIDQELGRVVALKVLAPQLAASRTARQRFLREARAAAAVIHDHVVTFHAVAEEKGVPYLVLQYIAGESLQQRLQRQGRFAPLEVARIGMQAAQGLTAAHAQGLIHRDIKLTNILLEDATGRVKITDFGLARAADDASLTQTGIIAGTPLYMSPEQAQGNAVDPRSDLFSLGSVLYALCTGVPPFHAANTMAVLRRLADEAPVPVRRLNPEVPDWLARVIHRLLAKDPRARIPSAAELAAILAQHLQPGDKTPAHKAWVRRAAALLAGASALVLFVLVLGRTNIRERGQAEARVAPVSAQQVDAGDWPGLVPQPARLPGGGRWQLVLTSGRAHLNSVVWDLDGTSFASGDDGGALRVIDTTDTLLRPTRILLGHGGAIPSVARSKSGRLASASSDRTVRVWEHDGRLVTILTGHTDRVDNVAWAPNEQHLVTSSHDNTVRLWDVMAEQGKVIHQGTVAPRAIAWSPDGRRLAGIVGQEVLLWDAEGTRQARYEYGHAVWALAWSADSRSLACTGGDHKLRLWQPDTAAPPTVLDIAADRLAWSPDGGQFAGVPPDRRREVHLWKADGTPLGRLLTFQGENIHALAWSPDGSQLAVVGPHGEALVWRKEGARQSRGMIPFFRSASVAWNPDGTRLASGDHLTVWAADGSAAASLGMAAGEVCWRSDGKWLGFIAAEGGKARFCSPEGEPGPILPRTGYPTLAANGRMFFVTDADREFQIWEPDGNPGRRASAGPRGSFTSGMAWDPAGQRLGITQLGLAFLWDVDRMAQPRLIADMGTVSVGAPVWSPDGQTLAFANGRHIAVHKADGSPYRQWEAHADAALCLAWRPDSQGLISSAADGTLRLWHTDGTPGPLLSGSQYFMRRLACSSSGRLASITGAGILTVWNIDETGFHPLWVGLRVGAEPVALDAGGRFLHASQPVIDDNFVYIVETPSGAQELLSPPEFRRRFTPR